MGYCIYMLNNTNTEILSVLPAIRATVARFLHTKCPDAIEDVVNDTVLKLVDGGMAKRETASVKSWATITARNTAINYLASHKVSKGHDAINGTDYDHDTEKGEASAGVILDGPDGRVDAIRADESRALAAAMDAVCDAQERAFLVASMESDAKAAGEAYGWNKVKACRVRKELIERLAAYLEA